MTEQKTLNEVWGDDLLGRREEAEDVTRFLLRRTKERPSTSKDGSYVLNLDAEWGHGKTFFLTHLKQHLELDGHPVVYINAWEDDYAEDAFISIVSSIRKTVGKGGYGLKEKVTKSLIKAAPAFVISSGLSIIADVISYKTGITHKGLKKAAEAGVDAVAEKTKEEIDDMSKRVLDQFEKNKESVNGFKKSLRELVSALGEKNRTLPMFILIDELDRCRPTYAIALLERVKHLFSVSGVVFIISTNTNQLQHSIKAVYGNDFDAKQYLARFFDRRYQLADVPREAFVKTLFVSSGMNQYIELGLLSSPLKDDHVTFFTGVADIFGLSLRDIDQCFDILHTIVSLWDKKAKIQLFALLPLIFAYHKNDTEVFRIFAVSKHGALTEWLDPRVQRSTKSMSWYPNLLELYAVHIARRPLHEAVNKLDAMIQNPSHRNEQMVWLRNQIFYNQGYQVRQGEAFELIETYPEVVKSACRWNRVEWKG